MRWKSKWDTTLRLFGSFQLVSVLHGRSSFVEGNWFEFTSPEFWAYLSKPWTDLFAHVHTGSPSSKYEHRRALALLRNIKNIRICMGKKPIVSLTYENERISIKKQLTLLKMCVTSLLCGPRADLWQILRNPEQRKLEFFCTALLPNLCSFQNSFHWVI